MITYSLKADPIDTLFFRGGFSYRAGETSHLKSIFPPTPHTGYGFSRAVLLEIFCDNLLQYIRGSCDGCSSKSNCPITDAVGEPSLRNGTLSMKGPYVFKEERLFAIPLDLTHNKAENSSDRLVPAHVPNLSILTDMGYARFPCAGANHAFLKLHQNFMISESDLISYLESNKTSRSRLMPLISQSDDIESLIYPETHTGIAWDSKSHTSLREHLYTIEKIRLHQGVCLWMGLDGFSEKLDLPTERLTARLGGEGKRAAVEIEKGRSLAIPDISDNLSRFGRLKILLLQHADFEGKWHPPSFEKVEDENGVYWTGDLNGVPMKLISAVTGKPVYIGGWDTAKGKPRPLKPLVPAGSVYYMQIEGGHADEAINAIHDKHIGLKTKLGFGHTTIGVWSNE